MSASKVTTGEADFDVPAAGKPCKTWYKVFGDLKSGVRPLVALHGGPGAGHNYLLSLEDLSTKYGIPVILYDQLGIGNSTHLQEKDKDTSFWTVDLFLNELTNILKHFGIQDDYDLYGNSWGGMLAAEHGVRQPAGLRHLIIADSPASMQDWARECAKLIEQLPKDVQDTIKKHEEDGTTDDPEYEEAVLKFYQRHLCRVDPFPKEVMDTLENIKNDPTVYNTMNGPSEFTITGSLKTWSIKGRLHSINVPTMLMNGRFDEATDAVVEPYFKEIKQVKWRQFDESSHMINWEEREKFMEVVNTFLKY